LIVAPLKSLLKSKSITFDLFAVILGDCLLVSVCKGKH